MTIPEVLVERRGPLGLLRLNRPRALNALSLEMIVALDAALREFAANPDVRVVAITGEGGRAFCSGGDVRSIALAARGEGDRSLTQEFFRNEYRLNLLTSRFPKPYVALVDGIVMGGGVGISAYGTHQVYSERTVFAMPETSIGFFPDVGSAWLLNRCPGETGTYLALTGARIGPADALALGLATHFVPSERHGDVVELLAAGEPPAQALARFTADPGKPRLSPFRAAIAEAYSAGTVETIAAAAPPDLEALDGRSPTALKVSLRHLRSTRGLSLEEVLRQDFRVSQGCMAAHDFHEGIRAQLIDKDRAPRWRPATIEEVTDAMVEAHFEEPGCGDLTFRP